MLGEVVLLYQVRTVEVNTGSAEHPAKRAGTEAKSRANLDDISAQCCAIGWLRWVATRNYYASAIRAGASINGASLGQDQSGIGRHVQLCRWP